MGSGEIIEARRRLQKGRDRLTKRRKLGALFIEKRLAVC